MKKSKIISYIYETTMCLLALIAVIFAILDFTSTLNPILQIVDNGILYIFIFDYISRLILSKNKKEFIKNNVPDLIAIIPFNSLFKIFRLAKLTKLFRLTKLTKILKLTRAVTYILRFQTKCKRFLNTNGFKYMLLLSIIMILIGALGIHFAEKTPINNSIWWAFVTVTTVGYGDISPSTSLGRIIASVLMIFGIGLIGSLTSTITSYFFKTTRKNHTYKEMIISDIKQKLDDIDSLSDDDIDTIATILKSLKH